MYILLIVGLYLSIVLIYVAGRRGADYISRRNLRHAARRRIAAEAIARILAERKSARRSSIAAEPSVDRVGNGDGEGNGKGNGAGGGGNN